MLEIVRKHTSLLVAVLAVTVLAASQAVAQPGATKPGAEEPTGVAPAGIAADTVDGKHAVGARSTVAARARKLVATDAQGHLPNNIIKKAVDADKLDGFDSGAFALRAQLASDVGAVNQGDNPVHWRQLKGVPAQIADGRDEPSVFWEWGQTVPLAPGGLRWHSFANVHSGYRVQWSAVPAATVTYLGVDQVAIERQPDGLYTYWIAVRNDGTSASSSTYTIRAVAQWVEGGDILKARASEPKEVAARGGPRKP